MVYRNEKLKFSPSYRRLRDFVEFIHEMITEIPLYLKRIEHILYENYYSTDIFLKVSIENKCHCTNTRIKNDLNGHIITHVKSSFREFIII